MKKKNIEKHNIWQKIEWVLIVAESKGMADSSKPPARQTGSNRLALWPEIFGLAVIQKSFKIESTKMTE